MLMQYSTLEKWVDLHQSTLMDMGNNEERCCRSLLLSNLSNYKKESNESLLML